MLRIAFPALLFLAAACGEDHHEHVTPAEDACEHMIDGPGIAVTAVDDPAADPPDLDESHHRYDVTLVALAADNGGYVDLVSDEAGEIHLFLGAGVPVTLWDDQGAEVPAESTQSTVAECTEVAVGHTFDLGVGTYPLEIGPTADPTLAIVPVHGGGDHAH